VAGHAHRLTELLAKRVAFMDGACGTRLQALGMPAGVKTELWALENRKPLRRMHREYADAGADVVLSCTFGGTAHALGDAGLVERANTLLAEAALAEVGDRVVVAASMGPTGGIMYPTGELRWREAYGEFGRQARALASAGIEVFFLETFSDPRELKAAVLAVRDSVPDAFISAQMTFGEGGRSLAGTPPTALAALAGQLPADAMGANCSTGPEALLPVAQEICRSAEKPVVVEPNAGLPVNGEYRMGPEEFAGWAEELAWAGAAVIGGCCGTGPDHIRETVELVGRRPRADVEAEWLAVLSSVDRVVALGSGLVSVGERVNPTGRRGLKRAIRAGEADEVVSRARAQERADVLDVNLGLERMVPDGLVREVFARLSAGQPLSVDLSTPELVEEAFRQSGGICLLNSLTATREDIEAKARILMRHGGYAVLLPLDEGGLGETVAQRLEKTRRGLSLLAEQGFPRERVIVDPIVQAVSAGNDPGLALRTLAALKDMGLLTVAGVSNVSHGLPARGGVNAAYLAMLAREGLDLAIVDVLDSAVDAVLDGSRLLCGGLSPADYSDRHAGGVDAEGREETQTPEEELAGCIRRGDRAGAGRLADSLLSGGMEPREMVESCLAPAMERVGRLYSRRRLFLPHLVAAAEASRAVMDRLEPLLAAAGGEPEGVVVLASVKGDIHDIGKNLVGLFLRNAGWEVHDLGCDVDSERVVAEARRLGADVVALSALMSTTAPRMEEVVGLLRRAGLGCRVIVGGAVVTGEYAESIGADGYAPDAYGAVNLLR
jgi:5-methyltetrahydrofolate--homocysteine methyltransferase